MAAFNTFHVSLRPPRLRRYLPTPECSLPKQDLIMHHRYFPTAFFLAIAINLGACSGPLNPLPVTPTLTFIPPASGEPSGVWTTYRNKNFGFSFEYPAAYDFQQYRSCALRESVRWDGLGTEIYVAHNGLIIYKLPDSYSQDYVALEDYVNGLIKKNASQWKNPSKTDSLISGVKAVRLEFQPTYGGGDRADFLDRDGYRYSFAFEHSTDGHCDLPGIRESDVYSHMVATFRFD